MMHRLHTTPELFEAMEWQTITQESAGDNSPLSLRWLALAALATVLLLTLAVLL